MTDEQKIPDPEPGVRCKTCSNYLLLCRHDLPWKDRAKSISLHTGWARSSHR